MTIEKVLVVDDSKVAHLTLRKLLSERDIAVDWVGSGEESIEYLKKQTPDAVFMDVMMPGMDGFETASTVNTDETINAPPIIMCSANTTDEDKQNASDNGAAGFLTKPYTAEELDDVLTLVTDLQQAATQASAAETNPFTLDMPTLEESVEEDFNIDFDDISAETSADAMDTNTASSVLSSDIMPQIEQSVEQIARRVATQTVHDLAEQTAREVAEDYQRKATQIAARAAQSIAERTAQSAVEEAVRNFHEQINSTGTTPAVNVDDLRNEIAVGLEGQIEASVTAALEADAFSQRIQQAIQQSPESNLDEKIHEIANRSAWEVIAAHEAERTPEKSSAAGKVANTALLFAIVALGLAGALFAHSFLL